MPLLKQIKQILLEGESPTLMSYLRDIYLELWFSSFGGGLQSKSEEYRESQVTTMNIFGYTFYIKKYILHENLV